ncbi:S-adenosyl-L-methionine-dependent methyltransferase [Dipodascopsis uninucleata]
MATRAKLKSGQIPKSWRSAISKSFQRINPVNYDKCVDIVKRLQLNKTMSEDFEIIDCYPGCGVWSRALNQVSKPKTHLCLEQLSNYGDWNRSFNADTNMKLIPVDPYKWKVYQSLLAYKSVTPPLLGHEKIHDSLLYTANLTTQQGPQLLSQFMTCVANRSWLQKFGRVRMLLWVREPIAARLLATKEETHRSRMTMLCELFTDVNPIAAFKDEEGYIAPSTKRFEKTPVLFEEDDLYTKKPIVLLDIVPKPKRDWEDEISPQIMEYILRNLYISPRVPLRQSINVLGPGASEHLAPIVGDLYDITPHDLDADDVVRLARAFRDWPFKPPHLFSVLDQPTVEVKDIEF